MRTIREAWYAWIRKIACDPKTDLSEVVEHLRVHVTEHVPPPDAHVEHWRSWAAGTFNLVAIIAELKDAEPTVELNIQRLWQKWRQRPATSTAPPAGKVELFRRLATKGAK